MKINKERQRKSIADKEDDHKKSCKEQRKWERSVLIVETIKGETNKAEKNHQPSSGEEEEEKKEDSEQKQTIKFNLKNWNDRFWNVHQRLQDQKEKYKMISFFYELKSKSWTKVKKEEVKVNITSH